jgi:hypothetical protein
VTGAIIGTALLLGLTSLVAYGEFFAKLVGAITLGGIFWIAVLLATLKVTRRSR